jgi:hypothetical protein
MDNAKYHKGLPPGTPRKGNKKSVLQAACTSYAIDFELGDLKSYGEDESDDDEDDECDEHSSDSSDDHS